MACVTAARTGPRPADSAGRASYVRALRLLRAAAVSLGRTPAARPFTSSRLEARRFVPPLGEISRIPPAASCSKAGGIIDRAQATVEPRPLAGCWSCTRSSWTCSTAATTRRSSAQEPGPGAAPQAAERRGEGPLPQERGRGPLVPGDAGADHQALPEPVDRDGQTAPMSSRCSIRSSIDAIDTEPRGPTRGTGTTSSRSHARSPATSQLTG
jgi:hypothetical protein